MDNPGESKSNWNFCMSPRVRLANLLYTESWADCTFLVGAEDPVSISAHKLILGMSSPVFDTMFNGSLPEGKGPIRVPDIEPEAFRMMLRYIYTNEEVEFKTYKEASEVYYAGRKYMVPCIQSECIYYLLNKLTPENACFAYEFATLFEEEFLLDLALQDFRCCTTQVLEKGSFYEAHINTITTLFAQEELNITSDLDLFFALERYTAETMGIKCLKRSFPTEKESITEDNNKDNNESIMSSSDTECDSQTEKEKQLIEEIRQAVAQIRFLTLTPLQFSEAARSILLTAEEAVALMMNLVGVNTPVPKTVSDSKLDRGIKSLSFSMNNVSTSTSYSDSVLTSQKALVNNEQNSAAAAEVVELEAMISYSVHNFTKRKRPVRSAAISTGDMEWRVKVMPGYAEVQSNGVAKFVGVMVECSSRKLSPEWECTARVTLQLAANHDCWEPLTMTFTSTYNNNSSSNGYHSLLPWSEVCENYLLLNTLKIDVRIVMLPGH